jgi:hypothetical protein
LSLPAALTPASVESTAHRECQLSGSHVGATTVGSWPVFAGRPRDLYPEAKPPAPSADHEWNDATKRWQLSAAAQSKIAAKSAALVRIEALRASSIDVMREHMLTGSAVSLSELQAIDDQIKGLSAGLE